MSEKSYLRNISILILWSLFAGVVWGLYEASVLIATQYRGLIGHDAGGIVNLYTAATVNYGLLGLILGVCSSAYMIALQVLFRQSRQRFNLAGFFPISIIVLLLVLWAGVYANRYPLARIPMSHPLSVSVSIGIIGAGLILLFFLTKLATDKRRQNRILPLPIRTLATVVAIPALVFVGALGVHGLTSGETESMPGQAGFSSNGEESNESDKANSVDGDLPNIILITVETLRADHLNLYGYDKPLHTPTIERLSREGVTFMNFYTNSSWTRASITSMMTSLLPQQHGATGLSVTLMDSVVTLPKLLEEQGYHTAAFVTNLNSKSKGFGFSEVYYDEIIESFRNPLAVSAFSLKPFLIRRMLGTKNQLSQDFPFVFPTEFVNDWYPDATNVNLFLAEWLESAPEKPLFLHIHYLDPHEPYLQHPYRSVQFNLKSQWTRDHIVELYDGEIEYLDTEIDRLLEILRAGGHLENSLLMFTGDHGEEFLDHGGWGHGNNLFNESLHVPLIVRFPHQRYAGRRVEAPASGIDLAPTMLQEIGVAIPETFTGRSLLPMIEGEEQGRRVIVAHLQAPSFEVASMMKDNMKFIARTGFNATKYLFNLAEDPDERNNLIETHPEIAAELESELTLIDKKLREKQYKGKHLELTEEEKQRLRALGYLK